jgi:hypothetical protein
MVNQGWYRRVYWQLVYFHDTLRRYTFLRRVLGLSLRRIRRPNGTTNVHSGREPETPPTLTLCGGWGGEP